MTYNRPTKWPELIETISEIETGPQQSFVRYAGADRAHCKT